jgi:spermidine/putrescine transport system substrate-binding protein
LLSLLLCILLAAAAGVMASCSGGDGSTTLYVKNWGEYMSLGEDEMMNVNEEFTKQTGIQVKYTTYETNEQLYTMLSTGSTEIDVIFPSDYMAGRMVEEGMLAELDFDRIPNYGLLDSRFKNLQYDPENKYTVPYLWGTVGIFYNTTMVDPEDVENLSWDLLWNEKYAGKILMFDNPRDAFAIAEAKLGYSLNTTDESELWASYEELLKQKKLLQAYVMDQVFSKMATGEAAIAPYYAGDGIVMLEENEDIAFGFPKETVNQFVDVVCIPKNSKNKEAAEQYINFLCSTETALANAEAVGYATPQAEAQAELDPEVRDDPMFYPPQEILDNTEIFMTLPKTVNKLMDDLWIKLKISRN